LGLQESIISASDDVPAGVESGHDDWPLSDFHAGSSMDFESGGESGTYAEYIDCTLAGAAGFFQITTTVFVVQGWDDRMKSATVA
jgi:hypothetical protein